MARFTVKHNHAIWETTTFEVKIPDPLPEDYDNPVDYVRDNLEVLMAAALDADTATVDSGDKVEGHDADVEIRDHFGNRVYTGPDDGKEC
jgi:hypothetical protein